MIIPPFKSHELDDTNAEATAALLLEKLHTEADLQDRKPTIQGREHPEVALGIILLLDQLSRNIYRSNMAVVYNHYDRLARALIISILNTNATPNSVQMLLGKADQHPDYHYRPVYRIWFYMPLMHSEYLPHHVMFDKLTLHMTDDVKPLGNEGVMKYMESAREFEKSHVKILERFGRYPYRNDILGRKWTDEERKWLEDGGDTFGVKM